MILDSLFDDKFFPQYIHVYSASIPNEMETLHEQEQMILSTFQLWIKTFSLIFMVSVIEDYKHEQKELDLPWFAKI